MPVIRQNKSLQEGTRVLWRLETEVLPAVCFHPYLHELRGRLEVKRKTELFGNQTENRPFSGRCPGSLYLSDLTMD
jgi:hypothetical protein